MVDEKVVEKVIETPVKKMRKPLVLNIIRYLSITGGTNLAEGVFSVTDVNEYISSFVEQGYKIVGTHYLGAVEKQGHGVLYILQLQ